MRTKNRSLFSRICECFSNKETSNVRGYRNKDSRTSRSPETYLSPTDEVIFFFFIGSHMRKMHRYSDVIIP